MIKSLFLSVGAMKAGTTWLYANLKRHPEIYFTPEKEIHYFSYISGIEKQLEHRNRIMKLKTVMGRYAQKNPKLIAEKANEIYWYANYARRRKIDDNWYRSLFSLSGGRKYCADFSNLYAQLPDEGWRSVYRVSGRVKVIYTLRDPLERVWSHYKFHMKFIGRGDEVLSAGLDSFMETIEQPWFWRNSEYSKNYSVISRNVPEEDRLLLYLEELSKTPKKELLKIRDFLGISPFPFDEKLLRMRVNRTDSIPFPAEWKSYAAERLEREERRMRDMGIWHERWESVL